MTTILSPLKDKQYIKFEFCVDLATHLLLSFTPGGTVGPKEVLVGEVLHLDVLGLQITALLVTVGQTGGGRGKTGNQS